MYVGDAGNNVVQQFNAHGNYISTIDGSTTPQGQYSLVAGVAVDQSGNLWTADGNTDNVDEFDAGGAFVQQWNDTVWHRARDRGRLDPQRRLPDERGRHDRALDAHRHRRDGDRHRLRRGAWARSADREPVRRSRR